MSSAWIGANSNNYAAGRSGKKIDLIVLHWMAGTLAATDSTFQNPTRQASAHYGIGQTEVHQYVKETDTAYHAGKFDINQRSLGIEHEGGPTIPITNSVYSQSISLVAELCQRWGIIPSADTIKPHKAFKATQCPGTLDLKRIIDGVIDKLNTGDMALKFPLFREKSTGKIYYRGFDLLLQHIPNPTELERFWPGVVPEDVDNIRLIGTPIEDITSARDTLTQSVAQLTKEVDELRAEREGIINGFNDKINTLELEKTNLNIRLDVLERRVEELLLENTGQLDRIATLEEDIRDLENKPPQIITKPIEELSAVELFSAWLNKIFKR